MGLALPLEKMEMTGRLQAYNGARHITPPSAFLVFIITFLLTPCVLMEALFVPLLGLILVCAVTWSGIAYLRVVGSWRCYISAFIGTCSALLLISLTSDLIKTYGEFPMYIILGFGTGINIASWLWFSGAKLLRLERGLDWSLHHS